jgi:hypothetical protein
VVRSFPRSALSETTDGTDGAERDHHGRRACTLIALSGLEWFALVKKFRCYLGFHRWQKLRNDDGDWYEKCRFCGKFGDVPRGGPFVMRQ